MFKDNIIFRAIKRFDTWLFPPWKLDIKSGFMCKIDYDHHIENDHFGCTIYPSEKALRKNHSPVGTCGIVRVEVVLSDIIEETDYTQGIPASELLEKTA